MEDIYRLHKFQLSLILNHMKRPLPIRDENAELISDVADDLLEEIDFAQSQIDRFSRQLYETELFVEKIERQFSENLYKGREDEKKWLNILQENREVCDILRNELDIHKRFKLARLKQVKYLGS